MAAFAAVLPPDVPVVPPAWLAFHHTVPDAAVRAATWRTLRDLGALNVQRRTWAVVPDPESGARLDELAARIHGAGGEATVGPVGSASADDLDLQVRLRRACERLWDDFATRADWYGARMDGERRPVGERVDELTRLQAAFAGAVVADIARSEAADRAEARLDRFVRGLVGDSAVDPLAWCRARPARRRTATLETACPLVDGTSWFAAWLTPATDPLWDLAFTRFEAATYRPAPGRVPLRAGTLRWTGSGDGSAELAAVDARIARFEASLA